MEEIAILDTGYVEYSQEQRLFSESGYRLKLFKGPVHDPGEKFAFASGSAGILVRGTRIDSQALARMPRLKAIVRYGTGYDNIDLEAAAGKGIRVANVQGYARHAVSDHALALMYACTRNLPVNGARLTGTTGFQDFGKPARLDVFELHEKTLGIIGIGHIGSHFSRKASPLFNNTLAFDPYKDGGFIKKWGAVKTGLEELLDRSHVISLHCSLTKETHHLLNEEAFQRIKNRPVIINTSRGPVLDERALLGELNEDRVHSAGLDVFELEPPGKEQQELLAHPRVVWTPHIAWYSDRAMRELQRRAAEIMIVLLTGGETEDEL